MTWLIHMRARPATWRRGSVFVCDKTHVYLGHDSFIRVTCLIYMRTQRWREGMINNGIRMCDMTHSYLCRDSFMCLCVTWLLATWDMTHSYVCHVLFTVQRNVQCGWGGCDSFICVMWLIYACDMTYSYVWRDSFTGKRNVQRGGAGVTHSFAWRDLFILLTWLIHMCDMTHSCVTLLICR